jgi:hypothetical protein
LATPLQMRAACCVLQMLLVRSSLPGWFVARSRSSSPYLCPYAAHTAVIMYTFYTPQGGYTEIVAQLLAAGAADACAAGGSVLLPLAPDQSVDYE